VAAISRFGSAMPEGLNLTTTEWNSYATPFYLAKVGIPSILMGLLLLGLLFADVAVTDKYILSWSTSIVNDCVLPFRRSPLTPRQHIWAIRATILILCVVFFLFGMIYKPTMPIWDFMWLLANLIGGTGIVVLLGMYWPRAKTSGAYACVAVCVLVPVADVIARQVHAHLHPGAPFPWEPRTTGLYTYLAGAALMVGISLLSAEKSKYWDLGKTVRQMNIEASAG
jgi:Na+/proline symporter